MSARLFLFDCEKQVNIPITSTETVIGRDSILQCTDKRISRQHGTIKLDDGEPSSRTIQITSTHTNPIFLRKRDQVLSILTNGDTATLQHGEKFALLPDQYWFEVRFRNSESDDPVSSSSSVAENRVKETEEAVRGSIRIRTMEEVNNAVEGAVQIAPNCTESGGGGEKRKHETDSEADHSKKSRGEEDPPAVKADPDEAEASTSHSKSPTDKAEAAPSKNIKQEPADSTSALLRPSCEFGIRCYRRTLEHRTQFAHPNDDDYRRPTFPPAPSDAPHCPYGAGCYRRNPQHFRDFQHPDSTTVTSTAATVTTQPAGNRNNGTNRRRGRRRLAQSIVLAALANPSMFYDDSDADEDDDDDGDLFDYEDDSDEYRPDGENDDDEDEDDEPELGGLDDENEE